jgi:CHASE3 domain sensor protein
VLAKYHEVREQIAALALERDQLRVQLDVSEGRAENMPIMDSPVGRAIAAQVRAELREENERLREALQRMVLAAEALIPCGNCDQDLTTGPAIQEARAALTGDRVRTEAKDGK